jgi:hypothetical protein
LPSHLSRNRQGQGAEIFKIDFKIKRRPRVDGGGKLGNGKGNDHLFR